MILMDEVTANVDTATSASIKAGIHTYSKNKGDYDCASVGHCGGIRRVVVVG